jgi:hypothetical protein
MSTWRHSDKFALGRGGSSASQPQASSDIPIRVPALEVTTDALSDELRENR